MDAIRGKLDGFLISIGPGPVVSNGDGGTKPSLVDNKGKEHILNGDETGGRHRAGTGRRARANFQVTGLTKKFLAKYQMWPQIRHQNNGPQVHAQFQSVRGTA